MSRVSVSLGTTEANFSRENGAGVLIAWASSVDFACAGAALVVFCGDGCLGGGVFDWSVLQGGLFGCWRRICGV